MITQEEILERFEYRDGGLYYQYDVSGPAKKRDRFGWIDKGGYRKGSFLNRKYFEHILIFLYHHGYLAEMIDHIDRNSLNNKIENLREVTKSQNAMNMVNHKNGSSKYKGVSYRNGKWYARIMKNRRNIYLGGYLTEKEAAQVYNKAAEEIFGEYAHLNEVEK